MKESFQGLGVMAQAAEHLPSKLKDLNSNHSATKKRKRKK
jgi:hypothetical protein